MSFDSICKRESSECQGEEPALVEATKCELRSDMFVEATKGECRTLQWSRLEFQRGLKVLQNKIGSKKLNLILCMDLNFKSKLAARNHRENSSARIVSKI